MHPLSPKQLEVLDFIRSFIQERGLPPTRGEIADGLGLKNRQGIEQHLRALKSKGAIELVPGISRGIRLPDDERSSLLFDERRQPRPGNPVEHITRASTLPLLGRIAAGAPILAFENIEEHLQVDPALFRPRADFILRVRGDSMIDANILDGDLLAVHRTNEAHNGQIVVARIDEEATVKYFHREEHRIRLDPANSNYTPIDIDAREQEVIIEGLAVGVIRRELSFGSTR